MSIRRYCILFLQACRVLLIATLLTLAASLCSALQESSYIVHAQNLPAANNQGAADGAIRKVKQSAPASRGGATTASMARAKAETAGPTPACTPFAGSGNAAPVTAPAVPGLKIVADSPNFYTIYGNSVAAVRAQLLSCQPDHAYAANTSYWLGARYSSVASGNGVCTLTNVSVMLRTHQVFPRLAATASTPAALRAQWQKYMSALSTHEQGHVTINQQYAQQVLRALQGLPPTACAHVDSAADRIIANVGAEMRGANDAYDARTNHGTTQGAIWR